MRYEQTIVFVKEGESYYDPDKHGYVEKPETREQASANVTDLGTNRSVQLFGDIKQGAKVIRLYPSFDVPDFDYIEYMKKTWEVITSKQPLNRHDLIIQEVVK